MSKVLDVAGKPVQALDSLGGAESALNASADGCQQVIDL